MPSSQPHPMTLERIVAKVQYIKDLSFEVPRAPAIYQDLRLPPELEVKLDVLSSPTTAADRSFEVILRLRVQGVDRRGQPAGPGAIEFIAELSYGGLFDLDDVPPEDLDEVLSVECPQILYPFACAILADLSRDANFAPITLSPVDFAQLWRQRPDEASRGRMP